MSLNPSDVALTVGQQQAVSASALLATGATRLLGGNGSILWNISWTPGIDVSACGTGTPQFISQNIQVDGTTGVFHATWSPTSPDTLKADGVMSLPTAVPGASVSAVLQCVNGASTGSMNALWNGTQYDGTFTFGAGGGDIALFGLTWTSSNPAVAPVDQAGMVRALAPGDAMITATFGSRCWLASAGENLACRGTSTATATVHVSANGGGGEEEEEGCAKVTFVLLPNSEPASTVTVILIDPPTGEELGMATLPIGQTITTNPGRYHLRLVPPPGLAVTPAQHGLNLACGDDQVVRVRFRRER